MQAIQTKVLPATNTKGTRIKAWCADGQLTMDYYDAVESAGGSAYMEEAHAHVALKLREKLKWHHVPANLITGELPDGTFAHIYTCG